MFLTYVLHTGQRGLTLRELTRQLSQKRWPQLSVKNLFPGKDRLNKNEIINFSDLLLFLILSRESRHTGQMAPVSSMEGKVGVIGG